MTLEEWDRVPLWRKQRLLDRIKESGRRCIDCFEQLTLAERRQGRGYCTACFPNEAKEED